MKLGLLPSPQNTTWESLAKIARAADALPYDSLWVSDHMYAPEPWPVGPSFEALGVLAAWAAITERVQLGTMVAGVGFRNPAVLAKAITTIDHISGGRICLGLGAGWFGPEHLAFGITFGSPGERVSRLADALPIISGMLAGKYPNGQGTYAHREVPNLPLPLQSRLPLLIGGEGNRMLGLVAQFADVWNIAGELEHVRQRNDALRSTCDDIGRDDAEIERTYHVGPIVIRDSAAEARNVASAQFEWNGLPASPRVLCGPPEDIAPHLVGFYEAGFRHMYFDLMSPHDEETLVRLPTELKPMLT